MNNIKSIIADINQLNVIVEQLVVDIEEAPDDKGLIEHLNNEYEKALNELEVLENKYLNELREIPVSRCPFTNEIYQIKIDQSSLVSPWWNAENPVREAIDNLPTFFALTGSVQINGEPPKSSFNIKPGPAVPWIAPRLLKNKNIVAVISHIKIGNYDAYPVVYFSKIKQNDTERINTWGTDMYIVHESDNTGFMSATYDEEDDYDFDLAPWIEKGKLLWIAPDDDDMTLHTTIDDCPYLNIEGYRYPVIIHDQKIYNCMIESIHEEEYESFDVNKTQITPHFCSNCGTPTRQGAKFCTNCGNKLI